ncbi:unnamed protein product [Rhizophagus irregularis]|nr:unnamed protein product [Rhizophagus irregularis]
MPNANAIPYLYLYSHVPDNMEIRIRIVNPVTIETFFTHTTLASLDENGALFIVDYKMRILPRSAQKTKAEFFGKRGWTLHKKITKSEVKTTIDSHHAAIGYDIHDGENIVETADTPSIPEFMDNNNNGDGELEDVRYVSKGCITISKGMRTKYFNRIRFLLPEKYQSICNELSRYTVFN